MRRRLSLLAVGGFAAASLFLVRAALAVDVAPPGSGFSAWFPVEPKESSEATKEGRTLLWVATDNTYIFIIAAQRALTALIDPTSFIDTCARSGHAMF